MTKKTTKMFILMGLLLVVAAPLAIAADQQPPRPDRGQRGGFDRQAMQERMLSMMQERLGASDEEWTVIKPRLSKVMELSRSAGRMGGGMRGMFGRGRRGRNGQNDNNNNNNNRPALSEDASDVEKAVDDLQQTLEKDAPTAAEIKAKLTALRGAKEKAKAELVTAQKSLREVLSLKQEAQMVMMGMLD